MSKTKTNSKTPADLFIDGFTIGNKPRYLTSQPSTLMKSLEVEMSEKRVRDAKDALERSQIEEPEDATSKEANSTKD
jgi:hypothetical protein